MDRALSDELVALTVDLLRFETVAERPDQLAACMDYVAEYLAAIPGIFVERSESGGKPAIVATLRETRTPALMLNGHLDVVVGRPEQFAPQVRDGRIYGRGAQDMKGSCAVMLRLVRDLAMRPERPDVGFQFVSDEEIGGALGTGRLLAEGWRCAMMLCLEPTNLGILYAHKGCMWVELALPGRPAHGSHPWDGHNPIGDLVRGLMAVEARYPPPVSSDAWVTTVTPTILQTGAGSRNQIPASVKVVFDVRYTADETPEQVLTVLRECFPSATPRLIETGAALYTDPAHPAVERLARLLEQRLGRPPRLFREHYATDARYYTGAGIPAVCLGPVGAGLHSDEEWVSIASLVDLYHVLFAYATS